MMYMNTRNTTQNQSNTSDHMLIEGEEKSWSEGTVHIFWPSATASKDDDQYVAWCREHASGELKEPSEVLPLEDDGAYGDRFCKTCLEKARESKNVEEPDFLEGVESKIESNHK